jgi:glycosyl-4,4'-diaponeurosporenoate acyltransferase
VQILYLPGTWTILLCFIVWPVLQYAAAFFCLNIPDRIFGTNSFFFRSHSFEQDGRIYDKIFRVSSWKQLLPEGSIASKQRRFKKKHLKNFSEENLNKFLLESARAELTHWLAILPFWLFGFFVPAKVIWYMLIYALLVNLPCIITQRYNRPRVQRLLNRMAAPKANKA